MKPIFLLILIINLLHNISTYYQVCTSNDQCINEEICLKVKTADIQFGVCVPFKTWEGIKSNIEIENFYEVPPMMDYNVNPVSSNLDRFSQDVSTDYDDESGDNDFPTVMVPYVWNNQQRANLDSSNTYNNFIGSDRPGFKNMEFPFVRKLLSAPTNHGPQRYVSSIEPQDAELDFLNGASNEMSLKTDDLESDPLLDPNGLPENSFRHFASSDYDSSEDIDKKDGFKRIDEPKKGQNIRENTANELDDNERISLGDIPKIRNMDQNFFLPNNFEDDQNYEPRADSLKFLTNKNSSLKAAKPFSSDDDDDINKISKYDQIWYNLPPLTGSDKVISENGDIRRRTLHENTEKDRFLLVRKDYAYIKLDHDLNDQSIAYRMLSELTKLLGLQLNTFSDIKITGPFVIFKVNPNLKSYNASFVAQKIKIYKTKLEKNLNRGFHIESSGIGDSLKAQIPHPIWGNENAAAFPVSYISDNSKTNEKRGGPGGSHHDKPFFIVANRAGSSAIYDGFEDGHQTGTEPYFKGVEPKSKILLITASVLAALMTLFVLLVLFLIINRRSSYPKKSEYENMNGGSIDDYEKSLLSPEERSTNRKSSKESNGRKGSGTLKGGRNDKEDDNYTRDSLKIDNSHISKDDLKNTAIPSRYTSPKWAHPNSEKDPTNNKHLGIVRNGSTNMKESSKDTRGGGDSTKSFFTGLASLFTKSDGGLKEQGGDQDGKRGVIDDYSSPQGSTNLVMSGSDSYVSGSPSFLNNGFAQRNATGSRRGTWYEDGIFNKMDSATGHIVLGYMEKRIENRQLIDEEWSDSLCLYVPAPFTDIEGTVAPQITDNMDLAITSTPTPVPYTESELADPIVQYKILKRSWAAFFENKVIGPQLGFQGKGRIEGSSTEVENEDREISFTQFEKSENLGKLSDRVAAPWGVLPYLHNNVPLRWTSADNEKLSLPRKKKSSTNMPSPKNVIAADSRRISSPEKVNIIQPISPSIIGSGEKESFKFINASFVTESDPRHPSYIAAQGPVNLDLACDFWQMVWDRGIFIIVNLTSNEEYENNSNTAPSSGSSSTNVFKYWPAKGVQIYSVYEVYLVSEHVWCSDYIVRSFYLKNLATNDTRTLTLFHYTAWPGDSVPRDTKTFLEFRRKVNKSYKGRSTPIIVHCNDGSGRTGTYILIDMILSRLCKGVKQIDIEASVEFLRDQRMKMVATKEQFEFSFLAISDEVQNILKSLYPTPTPPPNFDNNSSTNSRPTDLMYSP